VSLSAGRPTAGQPLRSPYELVTARRDASRPFVTSYDGADSCIELSAVTAGNAIAKAAGLLRDELGLEPGARVSVDLPVHWQLPVWVLAGLTTGLLVGRNEPDTVEGRIVGPEGLAAIAAGEDARADEVLACACDAFGMPLRGAVPAGVLDVSVAVRAHPDVFQPEPEALRESALLLPGGVQDEYLTTWAELVGQSPLPKPGARTWVSAEDLASAGLPERLLLRCAATDPVLRGGSVVLARNLSHEEAERLRAVQGAVSDSCTSPGADSTP
jgi:uncharacterized protein (TIGR03089 family)